MAQPSAWLPLRPSFPGPASHKYLGHVASELCLLIEGGALDVSRVRIARDAALVQARSQVGADCQPVRLAISILCDLIAQGWQVRVEHDEVSIRRPAADGDRDGERDRVRRALLLSRDEQLAEPAVRAFVRSMEARRLGPRGWCSIHSLMRDGEELAAVLRAAQERPQVLEGAIQPYLQFVTEGARCEHTGLRLGDVWRYFRHTWLTPARSAPGRSMMILVRDAAAPFHPVMGIAALSSSIVQQSRRDAWIGWDKESLLWRSLDESLQGILRDDFIAEGVLSPGELEAPTAEAVARLKALGLAERKVHERNARGPGARAEQGGKWHALARTHLYRSKRALALADVLSVRAAFLEAGFVEPTAPLLQAARGRASFRRAVARLGRSVKASRVGISMMDISIAGAIEPYSALLGGKMVSLLLASPQVRQAYEKRYAGTPSIIASGMKGQAVTRTPNLVLLCTTGLFGGGSSQYNRARISAQVLATGARGEVRFEKLDQSTSYSTFHFSQATLAEMKIFIEQRQRGGTYGSSVNGIFGEGVNPKMRKIRESLCELNLPDNELLQAGSPRALYVVALAHNFRDVLLGRSDAPDYILNGGDARQSTAEIAAFWRERWLRPRIQSGDVLASVASHTMSYPLRHGALVPLPELPGEHAEDGQMAFDLEVDAAGIEERAEYEGVL